MPYTFKAHIEIYNRINIIRKTEKKMSKEEKLNINITLTDESGFIVKGKSKVTLEAYKDMKEFHNLSILDETLEMMLKQLNQKKDE